MQLFFKRLLIIAKKILSDVHFSTQKEFEEYLKNHPGYRENTRFFVNGVQVKAPPKQKKKPSQRSTKELIKTYGKLGETTLEYCFNGFFRVAISKKLDLNGFYKRNEKIVLEIVNGFIKDSGYKKGLTSKEAESLFEYFLSKRNEEEKKKEEPKKEEPKKEEPKKNGSKISEQELGEIVKGVVFNEKKFEYIKQEYEEKCKSIIDNAKKENPTMSDEQLNSKCKFIIDMIRNPENMFHPTSPMFPLSIDDRINEIIPNFSDVFNETNEKLRKNGFAEIFEEEFRKKFNEIRFPLANNVYSHGEVLKFCKKHICHNFHFKAGNEVLEVDVINTLQEMKRIFPDLCKIKLFDFCSEDSGGEFDGSVKGYGETLSFDRSFLSNFGSYNNGECSHDGKTFKFGTTYQLRGKTSIKTRVKRAVIHEFAHLIKMYFHGMNGGAISEKTEKVNYRGVPIHKFVSRSEKGQKLEQAIEDLYNESMDNGDIYKLTWYASTEPEEFWAEIFAIYYDDKSLLPPNILTKLEEIINDLKS